ncbi:hypothetical protein IC611_22335 [Proteus mirabilis]
MVGDDGLLYLSGVPDSGKLEIRWGIMPLNTVK